MLDGEKNTSAVKLGQQGTEFPKRILSSRHRSDGDFSFLYLTHLDRVSQEMIPPGITHAWIETPARDWAVDPAGVLTSYISLPEYQTLLPILGDRKIPALLGEISVGDLVQSTIFSGEVTNMYLEGLLSAALLAHLVMHAKDIKMPLRDLFKLGKKVIIGATAVWAASPLITETLRAKAVIDGEDNDRTLALQQISYQVHPESFAFTDQLRGTLLSYKEKWLAKRLGNHPSFLTPIGGEHSKTEADIDAPLDQQLSYLGKWAAILKGFVVPETFYGITELNHDGRNWAVTNKWEIPELKQMVV